MLLVIQTADGQDEIVNFSSATSVAMKRIKMAMDIEGETSITNYTQNFAETLMDIEGENSDEVSTSPSDYTDQIAWNLVKVNTYFYIISKGKKFEVHPKDLEKIAEGIETVLSDSIK